MTVTEGLPEAVGVGDPLSLRRSSRDPLHAQLSTKQVQKLLQKIEANDPETVVLKLKDHLPADINCAVMDAILAALERNRVCQALYLQNHSCAFRRPQLLALIALLRHKKRLWCLNLGELYEVSEKDWQDFSDALPSTSVTHLYISEHVISADLKTEVRDRIRENRKKHDLHCNPRNLAVIERCTHCWWNPINSLRHAQALSGRADGCLHPPSKKEGKEKDGDRPVKGKKGPGRGDAGGGGEWRFSCACKEVCSSYEPARVQPTGRMFQCTLCGVWAHVACVLGSDVTDEDIEEMQCALCHLCRSRVDRERRHGLDQQTLSSSGLPKTQLQPLLQQLQDKIKKEQRKRRRSNCQEEEEEEEEEEGDWQFRCRCGETCSSYENARYHPVGPIYQCTTCAVWSHVACVLGERVSESEVRSLAEALCAACETKARRNRPRHTLTARTTTETENETETETSPAVAEVADTTVLLEVAAPVPEVVEVVDTTNLEVEAPVLEVAAPDTTVLEVDAPVVEVDTTVLEVDAPAVEVDAAVLEVDAPVLEVAASVHAEA
eukprot:gene7726-8537_t